MTQHKSTQENKNKFSGWVLLKNAFSALLGTFLVSVIGFILTPYLIHGLGTERFGAWTLIFGIVAMTELADFGISQGVQRYTAQYIAKEKKEKINSLANQAFTLVAVVLLGVSIPMFLVDLLLPVLFNLKPGHVWEVQYSMALLIVSMLLYVPMSVFSGVMAGFQKYDYLNANWIVFSIIRAIVLAGCVLLPNPLIWMAIAILGLGFLRFLSFIVMVKVLNPTFTFKLQWPEPHFFKHVVSYGGSLFFVSILGRILYTADSMVIGMLLNATAITHYAIGAKWAEILRTMLSGAIQVCFPAFSHLEAHKNEKGIRDILLNGSRTAMGFGILGASLMVLLARPVITLWVGEGYEESVPVMRWLGVVGVFTALSFPFEHYLKATHQLKPLFHAALFNTVLNLLITVFLIQKVGLIGAVWGTLAPLIPTTLLLIIPAACREAGITVSMLLRHLVLPLILPVIWVFGLAAWFHFFPLFPTHATTFITTLYWAIGISIVYMALWMLLDPIPRRMLNGLKTVQKALPFL